MKTNIEILVNECLSHSDQIFKEDENRKQFEKAAEIFQELIRKGFAQTRGYNLLSISDINTNHPELYKNF